MNQTRLSSLIESVVNVAIGFVVSLIITAIVLPAYGHQVTFGENFQMTCIFTLASLVRAYAIRRFFNSQLHILAQRLAGRVT